MTGFSEITTAPVELARCRPHPDNYQSHPPRQIERLRASLRKFGQVRSIVVQAPPQADGYYLVVAGHGVVKAAEAEGFRTLVARVIPAGWPPQKVKAYLAADNELARLAVPESEQLLNILIEAKNFDEELLEAIGYGEDDFEELLAEFGREDEGAAVVEDPGPELERAGELRQKWGVEPGQLWQLGGHRLLCGDCTERAAVERLMNGERAILFATDPPYLVNYDGTNHPQAWNKPSANKDWSSQYHDWDNAEQGEALYDGFISLAVAVAIEEHAAWYCWHASRNQAMLERVWNKHGAFVHQQIIWAKDRPVLTRSWYMWQHEPCLFGWIRGKKPPRARDDFHRTVWEADTNAPGTRTDHPTSKPLELFVIPMQQHTKPGELCYEPFAGSGSQIIAGEQLGRRVFALEINPAFVAVCLERWCVATGRQPELVES